MAENSGGEKNAAERVQNTRSQRKMVWVVAGGVLIVAVGWGIWLAYKFELKALPQSPAWDWIVALGFVALAVTGVVVLWKGPQWQVARVEGLDSKERFDKRNEARKTLATILGGVAFLTGGYFTWRNLNLAQEAQVTDRFYKATVQLGATGPKDEKQMENRLGGIYALEGIANESKELHWPIMEVLTAYVRENAKVEKSDHRNRSATTAPSSGFEVKPPAADIQAVLTVLVEEIGNSKSSTKNLISRILIFRGWT